MTHTCHWMGCKKQVSPKLWGCVEHWFRLPNGIRNKIWFHYRPGQGISKTPSEDYLKVAREAQEWIEAQELL